jgi:glycine/D-amino acid oxidase-like deaminating enzyme
MKVDYIIVGFGLAGMAFVAKLEKVGKSFVVFDNNENIPSRIVGGMYNPIILKRFTPAWMSHEMWQYSLPFYKDMERKFRKSYIKSFEINRVLHSVEEQNNWIVASDKAVMSEYMQPEISNKEIKGIHAPFGFGKLNNVGRVEGEKLLNDYKIYLTEKQLFIQQNFEYEHLIVRDDKIQYLNIEANQIIFSEGTQLHQNPFFNYLPMREAKGEMLFIEVPDLDIDYTIKSSVFLVPFGANKYVVGATYNWEDKTFNPTDEAKEELEKKLQNFLKLPYKILGYKVGLRPTIKDRRPLIGKHPKYSNLAVLNGLGTRGIIIAPFIANSLFKHLENGQNIIDEMNIKRYEDLLLK